MEPSEIVYWLCITHREYIHLYAVIVKNNLLFAFLLILDYNKELFFLFRCMQWSLALIKIYYFDIVEHKAQQL